MFYLLLILTITSMDCFLKLELNAILFPKESEIIICNGSFGSFTFSSKTK